MMDILGDSLAYDSSLPWLWIIEYLAGFKEVDTSILQELVEMAPESPDDLAKTTREMVALRCLEDLFGSAEDGASAVENKIVFDLSQSCEDVLQHILQEIPEADLKMGGPELSKWDVRPFIMHKRDMMPKCALQKLKDTILEGDNPLAASLKERSGLMCVGDCARSVVDDACCNAPTLRLDGAGTDAQSMAANGNLNPPTRENGNGLLGDISQNGNLLTNKRDRNDLTSEDMARHSDEFHEGSDHHANAKKLKQNVVCVRHFVEQNSVPSHDNELLEDFSARVVGDTEGKGCDFSNQSRDEVMEDSQYPPEDGHDECIDSGRDGQNGDVNDGELQHSQKVVGHVADKMPQATPVDEPVDKVIVDDTNVTEPRTSTGAPSTETHEKDSVNKFQGEMEHLHEEVSSDNDEYHDEGVEVGMKKSHFLCSQLGSAGWTEQNLCVKCNKDGQLLLCNTSSCPLVVHEHCLGSPANFDENGKFYCPFCAYSLAISEYLEAKKKAISARKELAAFIRTGLEHRPGECAERLHRKDCSHSEQNGHNEIGENGQLGYQGKERTNQNGQDGHDFADHLRQKSLGSKRQSEPSASHVNVDLPCSAEEINVIDETVCISNGEKVGAVANECPSVSGVEGHQDQAPANAKGDGDNPSGVNSDVAPVDQREAEEGIEEEDLRQASCGLPEKPVIALNVDGEETSEGENDKFMISNYVVRYRRREGQYTYPTIPQLRQLRRKKLPWTSEEEKILKKGVKKFTRFDDKNIPWKRILEFGSSVFLRGRTTIDLKDKWRNMCKGSPKSK